MAYVTQQIIKTTDGWATFDALGKPVPKDYWLFERVIDGDNIYYKFKLSDGVHLFAELPYQLLNGNSARISSDGFWEIFNDATQQYVKTTVKALGSDGKSAFEVWQEQPGNADKTVEEYLASLKGQDGAITEDAPADGKTYGRKDEGWTEVETKPLFLNLDLLFDAEGNPVASVTDEFIPQMVEAYTNKVDIAVMSGDYYPLMIKKGSGENDYQLSISIIDIAGPVASGNNDAIIVAYFFEVNSTSKSLKFGISSARIVVSGDGTKLLSDNGLYITPPNATTTTPGYMSPEDKQKVDAALIFKNITTVTTLTDLPIANYSIEATLSAASPISFAGTPVPGMEYMIDILNSGSADFDQPLPNADNCQSNETSVTCPAGKITAISMRYSHDRYVFRV